MSRVCVVFIFVYKSYQKGHESTPSKFQGLILVTFACIIRCYTGGIHIWLFVTCRELKLAHILANADIWANLNSWHIEITSSFCISPYWSFWQSWFLFLVLGMVLDHLDHQSCYQLRRGKHSKNSWENMIRSEYHQLNLMIQTNLNSSMMNLLVVKNAP